MGQMFATMRPYAPPPPPGVQPPPLWGREEHVRGLLGDRLGTLGAHRQMLRVDRFPDGAAWRDYFKANYGPTIAAYGALDGDAHRAATLDQDLAALAERHADDSGAMDWEYLLFTARKQQDRATSVPPR